MKALTSHNFKLEEITCFRNYNSKTFRTHGTKERIVLGPFGKNTLYGGEVLTEFHVKPIHYIGLDGKWHDLDQIASYFGNKGGMILKSEWENKVDMGYLMWYAKRNALIRGKGIRVGIPSEIYGYRVGTIQIPLILNTVTTVYPDPDPETTTVDGRVFRNVGGGGGTWADVHDGVGTTAADTQTNSEGVYFQSTTTTDQFDYGAIRSVFLFDTSSIPDGDTISAVVMSVASQNGKSNGFPAGEANIDVYTSTPASNTGLVTGDYANFGTTSQTGSMITHANWSNTTGTYNDFTFNATGRANVSKTGVSKFALRSATQDAANVAPTWSSAITCNFPMIYADTADTTSDPKLVVTHAVSFVTKVIFF